MLERVCILVLGTLIGLMLGMIESTLWIPVSERLPSDEEINKHISIHPNYRQFLCTVKFADYEPQTRLIYFEESGWRYMGEDYNKHVIAWKPLPEAYKD